MLALKLNSPTTALAVPAEYSKPSSVPEQIKHNQSNQLKIKQGLLVLQRAVAKDYSSAVNNLADALANKVKADIITLLKNGVLSPLLSPFISKAAEGTLSKVGEIVENITGSILDHTGLLEQAGADRQATGESAKGGVAAGDEANRPATLRELLGLKPKAKSASAKTKPEMEVQKKVMVQVKAKTQVRTRAVSRKKEQGKSNKHIKVKVALLKILSKQIPNKNQPTLI